MKVLALTALLCFQSAFADVYMHSMRGSNDRLNEANVNRNNGNRVFDSQNNAKGGYSVGPAMDYYEGSTTTIEWTNQHACGLRVNTDCNIVMQYMCTAEDAPVAERLRDGTTTNTINANADGAADESRGMHESLAFYQACQNTEGNGGLFVADRNLNGDDARYTRQNNNGNRNGLECPEERDYYPYWNPSPWKDVAILTSDTSLCPFFQQQSQNVMPRYVCENSNANDAPINEVACGNAAGTWTKVPAHFENVDGEIEDFYPVCAQAPFSRDNHLGNGDNGEANSFDWTMPTAAMEPCIAAGNCACAFRLRYNISTTDYNAWGTLDANQNLVDFLDHNYNAGNSPVTQDPDVAVGQGVGGYSVTGGATTTNVSLALNTNQYGRTFQDRSYTFKMSTRPADIPEGATIQNIGVRGKRGNIVQTYPSVEYDHQPNSATLSVGTFVHFQWTGADTNPANNAGEGTNGSDRSNVIEIPSRSDNYPVGKNPASLSGNEEKPAFIKDPATLNTLAFANSADCKSYEQLAADNNNNQNNIEQDEDNCMKLNQEDSKYVNAKPFELEEVATFNYMSTRNNNFTNRSQKSSITVTQSALPTWGVALAAVGAVVVVSGLAVAGLFAFARTHPHSAVANMFSRS